MKFLQLFKILSAPLISSVVLFNTTPGLSTLKAATKTTPATEKDLDFYQKMGVAYVCSASARGNDSDFEKSLNVAANLFTTALEQKHGGFIKEGRKKAQKIEIKNLYSNVLFQLLGGSIKYCGDNVPEAMKKGFKDTLEKRQELNK